MSVKQESCEERIAEQMEGRFNHMRLLAGDTYSLDEEDLEELAEHYGVDADEIDDDMICTWRHEFGLGMEVKKVVEITISWGGPADYIELELDSDNEVVSGRYKFQDWFDGASRPLGRDDLEIAERVFGPFDHMEV